MHNIIGEVTLHIMPNPFTARWTAKGSGLCLAHWELFYLGQQLEIDLERKQNDMGTYAIYSFIFPDDDIYAEGLPEDAWIIENKDWLTSLFTTYNIPSDETHLRLFYQAVNRNDWRCGSCGGCI
jgi:hypothetical protein